MVFDSYIIAGDGSPKYSPDDFVNQFMDGMPISVKDLQAKRQYPYKVKNDVSLPEIRCAISLVLRSEFGLTQTEIANLVGYKDRSTVTHTISQAIFRLKLKDKKFMKYYTKAMELIRDNL